MEIISYRCYKRTASHIGFDTKDRLEMVKLKEIGA